MSVKTSSKTTSGFRLILRGFRKILQANTPDDSKVPILVYGRTTGGGKPIQYRGSGFRVPFLVYE